MKKIFFLLCFLSLSAFAQDLPKDLSNSSNTQDAEEPKNALQATPQSVSDEQFSGLAFAAPNNTAKNDDDINIKVKTQDHLGALVNESTPVFGQNLFGKQCSRLHQARFFNPDYRLTVGDKINLQLWGAFQFAQVLPVDTQGNIFIPEVGPVRVEGVENKNLNELIKQNVKKIFSKDVHTYADLVTAQPVQVYVTGFVKQPGLYDGLSSDSVIYFLCAAGGINTQEGSFRNIQLIRMGKVIKTMDLYDFLLNGNIAQYQLHQGDTLVVKSLNNAITVDGNVKRAYQYEWKNRSVPMHDLIKMANIQPDVTYVRVQRNQGEKPTIIYKRLREARNMRLLSGDRVTFVADKEVSQLIVTFKGQIKGRHQYVVERGTSLDELLKQIDVTPFASLDNVQLYRETVAKQQQEAINSSLARLEKQVMTSSSTTEAGAKIQVAQSEMIMKFIQEAKQAKLQGQVVLGDSNQWKKVMLENNDVINVPQESSVVTVSGDVVNALSLEVEPRYTIKDYIQAAGGFDKTANKKEILLMKQSGRVQVVKLSSWNLSHVRVEGGDQIIILAKMTTEGWQITETMSKILYQIAIAARVALVV